VNEDVSMNIQAERKITSVIIEASEDDAKELMQILGYVSGSVVASNLLQGLIAALDYEPIVYDMFEWANNDQGLRKVKE
jgi:hypothetical protein